MFDELGYSIFEMILDEGSLKVKKEYKFKDYLKQYKKDRLISQFASIPMYNNFENTDELNFKVIKSKNMKKAEIIDLLYFYKELLIDLQLKNSGDEYFKLLKTIVKNNGYIEIDISKVNSIDDSFNYLFDMMSLYELTKFSLIFMEYNLNDEKLIYHIPNDIFNIIKSKINSKQILNYRQKIKKVKDLLYFCINVYGVISLQEIVDLYYNRYKQIDKDEFKKLLIVSGIVYKEIMDVSYIDEELVIFFSIEFDNENEAFDFYNSRKGNYIVFGNNEIIGLKNNDFIHKSKYYMQLKEYLIVNFTDINMKEIDEMLINNYINIAQVNLHEARISLSKIIDDNFEYEDIIQKNKILKLIDNIRLSYPSWKLKGKIIDK